MSDTAYNFPIGYVPVTNGETEACPPYGVCQITSISASTGIAVIGKPTANGKSAVFFNGPTAIPAGGSGAVHQTFPAIAAYQANNDDNADPSHDEVWGTTASSWYLHQGKAGFQSIGTGGYGLMNIQRADRTAIANYNAAVKQFLVHDANGDDYWQDTTTC